MPQAITETQFLNRIDEPPSSEALDLVRLLRTALFDLSPLNIAPEFILPSLRVESDLGVHHLDSLNLVDLATFIESDNFSIGSEDLQRLADLNNRDGTVKELALIILNAFRNSNQKNGTEHDCGLNGLQP